MQNNIGETICQYRQLQKMISYLQVKQELKRFVEEGKSIHNLLAILEDMEMSL